MSPVLERTRGSRFAAQLTSRLSLEMEQGTGQPPASVTAPVKRGGKGQMKDGVGNEHPRRAAKARAQGAMILAGPFPRDTEPPPAPEMVTDPQTGTPWDPGFS